MELTEKQILAIQCAYADLKGALDAYESQSYSEHDWESHAESIGDLEDNFQFLNK